MISTVLVWIWMGLWMDLDQSLDANQKWMFRIRIQNNEQQWKQCCGFGMFIPDPNFFHPGSASKNSSILTQKTVSKLSEIWSGYSFRIWIPDPDFLPIPDPESIGQQGTGSRIRITRGELPEGAVAGAAGDAGVGRGEAAHCAQLTRWLNRFRHLKYVSIKQCCGSGSAFDFGRLDPDQSWECRSRSGPRRARKDPQIRKKVRKNSCFEVLDFCFWGREASTCNSDVLYWGLGNFFLLFLI